MVKKFIYVFLKKNISHKTVGWRWIHCTSPIKWTLFIPESRSHRTCVCAWFYPHGAHSSKSIQIDSCSRNRRYWMDLSAPFSYTITECGILWIESIVREEKNSFFCRWDCFDCFADDFGEMSEWNTKRTVIYTTIYIYIHVHLLAHRQTNTHTSTRMLTQIQMMDVCVCVCLSSLSTVIIGIVEEKCECERQVFAWYRKSNKQRVTQPDDASVG